MNVKKLFKKQCVIGLVQFVFVFTFLLQNIYPLASDATSYLNELFDDLKIYKTVSRHRGDLYEHSLWTERYLSCWACGQDKGCKIVLTLMEKLTQRQKELLACAGALHDIGKAGDPDCSKYETFYKKDGLIYYFTKKYHERIGFEYVLHDILNKDRFPKAYLKVDGKPYFFNVLFKQLKLTKQEQLLIAVLIGSHRIFSELYYTLKKKKDDCAYENAAKNLKSLVLAAECTQVDHLIEMVVLLAIADLYSTYYPLETAEPSLIWIKAPICKRVRDFPEEAQSLDELRNEIACVGLTIKNKFEEKYKELIANDAKVK